MTDITIVDTSTNYAADVPESCVVISSICENTIFRSRLQQVLAVIWTSEAGNHFRSGGADYRTLHSDHFDRIDINIKKPDLSLLQTAKWSTLSPTSAIIEANIMLHFSPFPTVE